MKRGFPRPRTMVGKTGSNPYAGTDGSYGAKWEDKEYPHPYTANDSTVSNINMPRLRESARNKICGTCGLHVKEDVVGLIIYNDKARAGFEIKDKKKEWLHAESGPYHLSCLSLNFTVCPMLAETKSYFAATALWDDVKDIIREKAKGY